MSQTAPTVLYHDPCQHKKYRVSCAVFDSIWQRNHGKCEICGTPEDIKGRQKLCIDHAATVGDWAIRGLLCGDCNTLLCEDNEFAPEVRTYLDGAWYLSALAEIGLSDEIPEPPTGSTVRAVFCNWTRSDDGWACMCGTHRGVVKQWRHLYRRYGPFQMRTNRWPQHPADR